MGAREVAMLFVSQRLRVVLLTRHLPLRRVPLALTPRLIRSTLRLTARALQTQFRIPRPRLAVCGLNPHAGEAGQCGEEEVTRMTPILRALRAGRILCDGPFAADGFFAQQLHPARSNGAPRTRYDAIVCAYHDQGLIPFKMVARDAGCQLTIGLPIIRTSPDHGTALDIAGRGIAHPGSMIYALQLAAQLGRRSSGC
jgi:4-hydroxythreonine-4-phosphate dehydrogenase